MVLACGAEADKAESVAVFKGLQVTGVTVSSEGRIFVNFPRWRNDLPVSVAEVFPDGSRRPYPDERSNSWKPGEKVGGRFVCVQSVWASGDRLYVLDTDAPFFAGVLSAPKLYVHDLNQNRLADTYVFPPDVFEKGSYINDLRIDEKRGQVYFTDSGVGGIVTLDLKKRVFKRHYHRHKITRADRKELVIDGGRRFPFQIHSDGIALDRENDILYIHALTGYLLHGIRLGELEKEKAPFLTRTTPAPDGMIMSADGKLYFGDLEKHRIVYLTPDGKSVKTLLEGEDVRWADSFSIHDGFLYYTNSRIHEVTDDISQMEFHLKRIKL